jgi:hypothetical protein
MIFEVLKTGKHIRGYRTDVPQNTLIFTTFMAQSKV